MSEFKIKIKYGGEVKDYVSYAENKSELELVLEDMYPDIDSYEIEEVI